VRSYELLGHVSKMVYFPTNNSDTCGGRIKLDYVSDKHINLRVKRLSDTATLPNKANRYDAGIDLYADETVKIKPLETKTICTGISLSIPKGFVGLIWDRSSMGCKGIHRFSGVIDSGYTGEVKICLHNSGYGKQFWPYTPVDYIVTNGDKIAQMVIQQIPTVDIQEVTELLETERGEKGFGSSGA